MALTSPDNSIVITCGSGDAQFEISPDFVPTTVLEAWQQLVDATQTATTLLDIVAAIQNAALNLGITP